MTLPTPLITADDLRARLAAGEATVLLDCSFDLADPSAGARAYAQGHLPGARLLDLDRDLSGPKRPEGPVEGGRHPLPGRDELARRAGLWGIAPEIPVVVYDAQGSSYAARAWWLLRWLGHGPVAVLDGGLSAWQAAGGTLEVGVPELEQLPASHPPYPAREPGMPTVTAAQLLAQIQGKADARRIVVDARARERFRGDVEPLDRRAGHIPGARHRFFRDNLDADGRFRPVAELRAAFDAWGTPPQDQMHQCGSGVTACHNLLAMAAAGLPGAALYPGSWSEWSADPARPVALGD